jgi:hypothetical protein
MPDHDQPNERQALRNAILAAQRSLDSLPSDRRQTLQARFESASTRAQQQAEYVRP